MISQEASVDVALLQEATKPRTPVALELAPELIHPWRTSGSRHASCAVAAWRPNIRASARRLTVLGQSSADHLQVSRPGSLAVIDVQSKNGPVTLVSAYAFWETALSKKARPWIYADASAHRLVSDISALIDSADHQIIVAGDFNIFHGYGDNGSEYWHQRYRSVFERFQALGLVFQGPTVRPGHRAALPIGGANVATFHTNRESPERAQRQLDFVFASVSLVNRLGVRAINAPSEWGPSDHCRIEILLDD